MRSYKNKHQLFVVFLMTGFFAGILYANIISSQYTVSNGIFNEYFLKQYAQTDIVTEEYIWYILQVRVVPLALVCLLGCLRWKKVLVGICVGWTGFSGGVVAVAAVMALGIKGIFLCIAGIFPQIIFYAFTYIVLLWYFYNYPNSKWNVRKTTAVGISMGVGVLLEVYTNPILMKMMIGMF